MSRHLRIPGTPTVPLWPDSEQPVTHDQKLDILEAIAKSTGGQYGYAEDLGKRCDRYFGTLTPGTLADWVNAANRETWKDNHGGDPTEWDRVARAGGLKVIGRLELTRFDA